MRTIKFHTPARGHGYSIYIGDGAIDKIGELFEVARYSQVFVVTDEVVGPLLLDRLITALPLKATSIVLPSSEKHKGLKCIQKIWTAMHAAGCDRQALVINVGGGVVCDMGGFAASTYMRGVDFINVPTTLLAQVDASVGGKTGFDFDGIKNLIGTFSQPVGIVVDPGVLASLPKREFLSGFSEIIKQGLIYDKTYFEQVSGKLPLEFNADELANIVAKSCQIKVDVVQADETEGGTRKLLNFGHTVGHAIEALCLDTPAPLLHGEAISIGMAVEADISRRLGLLPMSDLKRIEQVLRRAGLPITLKGLKTNDLLQKMSSDKKNAHGQVNFTLLNGIGHAVYDQKVDETIVLEALEARLG